MDDEQKLAIIAASRGTLENEQYAAKLDLELAERGDDPALEDEPRKRLKEVNSKLELLDEREAEVDGS